MWSFMLFRVPKWSRSLLLFYYFHIDLTRLISKNRTITITNISSKCSHLSFHQYHIKVLPISSHIPLNSLGKWSQRCGWPVHHFGSFLSRERGQWKWANERVGVSRFWWDSLKPSNHRLGLSLTSCTASFRYKLTIETASGITATTLTIL